jgi:hypothetical protein
VICEHQIIGVVEKRKTDVEHDHWVFRSADGKVTGRKGRINEAVFDLFDAVVREPIRKVEEQIAKSKLPYQPPVTIDGVSFNFEAERVDSDAAGKTITYSVQFPQHLENDHTLTDEPIWHETRNNVLKLDHPDLWAAWHYDAGRLNVYRLECPLPLGLALRWLYMHSQYLAVRWMRELDCYDHSIMRLIEAGEGLFSVNTYRELLGFTPSLEPEWKVYAQEHGRFEKDKFIEPEEHYALVFQSNFVSAFQAFDKQSSDPHFHRCLLLLSPENRLADTYYSSNQHARIKANWRSIFGEDYRRLTAWEETSQEFRMDEARRRASEWSNLIKPSSRKKPN